jgi:hypothetical protein
MNCPAWIIYMNRVFFELQMHSLLKDSGLTLEGDSGEEVAL